MNKVNQYKGFYKHGIWEYYTKKSGRVYLREEYNDGVPHGIYETFSRNGKLNYRATRNNGKTVGLTEYYKCSGKLAWKKYYIQ